MTNEELQEEADIRRTDAAAELLRAQAREMDVRAEETRARTQRLYGR